MKGHTLDREGKKRFTFETTGEPETVYEIKITSGEHKGKHSYVYKRELDKTVIFEERKTDNL